MSRIHWIEYGKTQCRGQAETEMQEIQETRPWVKVEDDDTPISQMTIMPGLEPTRREQTRNQKLEAWFPTVESISRLSVEQFQYLTRWSKDRAYTLQEETLKNYGVSFTPLASTDFMRLGIINNRLRVNLYRMNLYTTSQLQQVSVNEIVNRTSEDPRLHISAQNIAIIEKALYAHGLHLREEPIEGYNLLALKNRKDGSAMLSSVNPHNPETGLALLDDMSLKDMRRDLLLERREQLLRKLDLVDTELRELAPTIVLEYPKPDCK